MLCTAKKGDWKILYKSVLTSATTCTGSTVTTLPKILKGTKTDNYELE